MARRRTQRRSSLYSAPAVVSRKSTIMGSHKLRLLYNKARDNKAITAAIMAVVVSISAMFISSKGGYLESWTTMREMLKSVPGGNTMAAVLQRIMDSIRRVLGWGIIEGDVVEPHKYTNTFAEKNSYKYTNNQKVPTDKLTYEQFLSGNSEPQFIVAKINPMTRTFNAILLTSDRVDLNKESAKALIKEGNEEKKPNGTNNTSSIILRNFDIQLHAAGSQIGVAVPNVGNSNAAVGNSNNQPKSGPLLNPFTALPLKVPRANDMIDFKLDHFKKSKQSDQFKKEKP